MVKKNEGFTLLELLIAVAILSVVIGPYFTQFLTSTEIGERSERIVRAEFIAQMVLEEAKRVSQVPTSGNTRVELIDGFTVNVTYSDESDSINNSTDQLTLYSDNVNPDFSVTPSYSLSGVDIEFQPIGGGSQTTIQDLSLSEELTFELESTGILNQYTLSYLINDDNKQLLNTFNKIDNEKVVLRFDATSVDQSNELLNIHLKNSTQEESERTLELYEYNDQSKSFDFSASASSSGDVTLFLKLATNTSESNINDLSYYWVHIEVVDSSGDLMAELHSAIREE